MDKAYHTIIIGSGFAGIAAAINLQKNDISNYLILERDAEMGGTWYANTYPGAQVDVPSHLYSLSFEPYDWSRVFAYQHEILKYTNHVIEKHNLRSKTKCSTKVSQLKFDKVNSLWEVITDKGLTYKSTFVINASGGLSQPKIPQFKNFEKYCGKTMHTAQWDHSFDYKDKKIAVIGSAASAIQVIPELAPMAKHLHIFQRSAHWILPRPDRAFTNVERKIFKSFPLLQKAYRTSIFAKFETRVVAFQYVNEALKFFQKEGEDHIKKNIKNDTLRKNVMPDYLMGCKRILMSNNYYPALNRANVTLLTKESGVQEFTKNGILTVDGQQLEFDLIVFATGFHASENVVVYPVIGKNGKTLNEAWESHAHAYLGTTVPNFPNLFLMAGPNTGTGHTSALGFLEAQLEYIMRMIKHQQKKQWKTIEIKADIEEAYNKSIQKDLANSVWQTGGCHSWYQTEDGYNTTMYPRFTNQFISDCKNFKVKDHLFT